MDGGVRFKRIGYSSVGCWDFLALPEVKEAAARQWFTEHAGDPYDLMGNIRFAFGFVYDSGNRWFCSEACMAALRFKEAYRYGPSGAATILAEFFNAELTEHMR